MQAYDISLDMKKAPGRIERTVTVRRGDNDTQQIRASITAGGQPYTPKGTARLDIMHADGTWARCSASVSGSTATCTLPSAALNGVGRCRAAHFVFTDGAKVESTEGFALVIQPDIDSNGSEQAKDYDDELNQMNQKWTKLNAEAERAERDRVAKEAERVSAEADRKSRETERASAESDRKAAESERKRAEEARKASETSRADKERERIAAETARAEAERGRASAETARARAESAREDAQAKNNADQALNNEQMKKLSPVILQEGQYDRATLKPSIEGEPNRMYFVPMVAPAAIELYDLTAKQVEAGNLYVEWMWVGGKWEQMGQSEIKARPISTDQVDAVFSGAHPTGDSVLNLTGLDYTHGKVSALLDGKAGKSHVHAVADVTGLRGELDGKAGAGHKHGAGDITSGTLHVDRVPELPIAKVTGLQGELDGKQPLLPKQILREGDLNDITETGTYGIEGGSSIRNFPSGAYQWGVLEVSKTDDGDVSQTYHQHHGSSFKRVRYGGDWGEWANYALDGHGHATSEISGLDGQISELRDSIRNNSAEVLYHSDPWVVWHIGTACFVNVSYIALDGGSWASARCPYTVPGWLRPNGSRKAPMVTANGASWTGYVSVEGDGSIACGNYGNGGSTDKRAGFLGWMAGN